VVALGNLENTVIREDARLGRDKKKKIFTKNKAVGFITGVALFFGSLIGGASCVPTPPPNTDTQKPVIQVENHQTDEGLDGEVEFYASDNEGIKEIKAYIPGYETNIVGDEPNFSAKYSPLDPNDNGLKTLTVEATDVNGNYAKETADFNVADTPDCVFVDVPDAMNAEYHGTAQATFAAEDDYNLEDLIASGSCSNPDVDVQVNKLETGLYKLIADASKLDNNEEVTYDINLVLEDPVEDISNKTTLPFTIGAPPASYITINLSFEGIDVHDDDNDGIIDRYTTGNDIGQVAIEAYKVPVTSYDETSDAIYFNVDRNNKEKVMDWTNYDASEGASFQLPQGNWQDYLLEVEVKDNDNSHHNYSCLINPSKDSVTKHIVVGEDQKILNILLGYGVGNHPDSAEQPIREDWEMPYTTTTWLPGYPNQIWFYITPEDEAELTDVMYDSIYRSLDNWFPGVEVIEKSEYTSPIPDGVVLVRNNDTGGAAMREADIGQYIEAGGIRLPYDTEGQWTAERLCEEETATVKEGAAEPQGLGENTVYSGGVTEKTPADEAAFYIKYNNDTVIANSIVYNGDPWVDSDVWYRANALKINGKISYVKPIRRDF
jgi:hypothetical protein